MYMPYAFSYSDNSYKIMMKAWNITEYITIFLVYLTRDKCQHFQMNNQHYQCPSLCVSWGNLLMNLLAP